MGVNLLIPTRNLLSSQHFARYESLFAFLSVEHGVVRDVNRDNLLYVSMMRTGLYEGVLFCVGAIKTVNNIECNNSIRVLNLLTSLL